MIKHLFLFLGTFVVGALIALTVRAARFDAHATPASAATTPVAASSPSTPSTAAAPVAHDHAAPAPSAPSSATPVNSVCAICGMEVDPDLPTATYQGKTIGFGCKACPAKFAANPDKYGPSALRNEVVK